MTLSSFSRFLVAGCLVVLSGTGALATANLGGVIFVLAGSGTCSDNRQVPGNTPQDTFASSAAASCLGGSATVDLRGDAAGPSIGLLGSASTGGPVLGSSLAAAQLFFSDSWLLTPPPGTAAGTISIPVSFTLDGSISPGAIFDTGVGRFLDYGLSIRDVNSVLPGANFSVGGSITATGPFSQTFHRNVDFRIFGPGSLPTTAQVSMNLFLPGLWDGTVDFFHTASISMTLPAGFTAATSSGIPLFVQVPEPRLGALLLPALGLLLLTRRRGVGTRIAAG